ncbi:hypothetical protein [Afifella pfennigii]|uniref:hypothetical protein n=1 Tax=Afifella pfennigii TaxID=209897 RepID=UPI00047ECBC7|nr:hypothetical protein [Afifella pfennigii]
MAETTAPDDKRAIAAELQGRLMVGLAVMVGLTLLIALAMAFGPGANRALEEVAAAQGKPRAAGEAAESAPPAAMADTARDGAQTRAIEEGEARREPEVSAPAIAPEYRTILYDARLRPAL